MFIERKGTPEQLDRRATPQSRSTGGLAHGIVLLSSKNHELPLRPRLTPAITIGSELESLSRLCYRLRYSLSSFCQLSFSSGQGPEKG